MNMTVSTASADSRRSITIGYIWKEKNLEKKEEGEEFIIRIK